METVNKARSLPVFKMGDTDFYVDTGLGEFREVNTPGNRISMAEIDMGFGGVTEFVYDLNTKNIYQGIIDSGNIPPHVKLVIVPSLMTLDPVGLARKFGLADNAFSDKNNPNTATREKDKINKHKKGHKL